MIIEQGSSNFPQLTEGLHPVVIAEVREVEFDDKPYGASAAQIEELKQQNGGKLPKKKMLSVRFADENGDSAEKLYTPSLHEKATFTKALVLPLFGSIPPKFDTDKLVGTQARILVVDKIDNKGREKANVESVMKPLKNQAVPLPKKKAKAASAAAPTPAAQAAVEEKLNITDDDVPF